MKKLGLESKADLFQLQLYCLKINPILFLKMLDHATPTLEILWTVWSFLHPSFLSAYAFPLCCVFFYLLVLFLFIYLFGQDIASEITCLISLIHNRRVTIHVSTTALTSVWPELK